MYFIILSDKILSSEALVKLILSEDYIYMDTIYSDFAYDDAYRTMESECDDLLIPFVNYFHNENYD